MVEKTKPIIVSVKGITISVEQPIGNPETIELILKGVVHSLLGSNYGDDAWLTFAKSQVVALESLGIEG